MQCYEKDGTYIILVSKFMIAVCELAVIGKTARSIGLEVSANRGLVLLDVNTLRVGVCVLLTTSIASLVSRATTATALVMMEVISTSSGASTAATAVATTLVSTLRLRLLTIIVGGRGVTSLRASDWLGRGYLILAHHCTAVHRSGHHWLVGIIAYRLY